jgi:WD40 repeat protein
VESLRSIGEALQLPLPPVHSLGELRTEAVAALALPDLEVLQEWQGFPPDSAGLDFDGNLERYAHLATDGTVRVHRVSDNTEISHWQETTEGVWPYAESDLRFSPDGRFLCIRHSTSGRLTVRRLDGSEPIVCHEGANVQGSWAMDFSSDSKRLAYLLNDTRIVVVDLISGQPHYLEPAGVGQDYIQFAPDGSRFAVSAHRATEWAIEVRDAATGQVLQSLRHPGAARHSAWHPNNLMDS